MVIVKGEGEIRGCNQQLHQRQYTMLTNFPLKSNSGMRLDRDLRFGSGIVTAEGIQLLPGQVVLHVK